MTTKLRGFDRAVRSSIHTSSSSGRHGRPKHGNGGWASQPAILGPLHVQKLAHAPRVQQSIRSITSTPTQCRQSDRSNSRRLESTATADTGSDGAQGSATSSNSNQGSAGDAKAAPRTSYGDALQAAEAVEQEMAGIRSVLRDPDVQITPEGRTRREAELVRLKAEHKSRLTKAAWWQAVFAKSPQEVEKYSDVYERVRVVQEALKTDAEHNQAVWTGQEHEVIQKAYVNAEADTRKRDKWYKKIAWGPSIVGTAILNMIFT